MRSRQATTGFTLIELLVVIAIIAILAAILFPVFARAKQMALLSGCESNLKQWGTAMALYLDDWKDRYPFAGAQAGYEHDVRRAPLGLGGSPILPDALDTYVKTKKIRWCPTAGNVNAETASGWTYWWFCPHKGKDPKGNPFMQWNGGKAALCGQKTSIVQSPASKPMICETSSQHFRGGAILGLGKNYVYPILYCDYHVKAVPVAGGANEEKELVNLLYVGVDGSVQFP